MGWVFDIVALAHIVTSTQNKNRLQIQTILFGSNHSCDLDGDMGCARFIEGQHLQLKSRFLLYLEVDALCKLRSFR